LTSQIPRSWRNSAWILTFTLTLISAQDSCAAVVDQAAPTTDNATASRESPWLIAPLVSSDPKLGTSIGGMVNYLHHFDPASSVSFFGVGGLVTSTESKIGAVYAKTYFDEDRQRLVAFAAGGEINNDYKDFEGTGFPLSTEDHLKAVAVRYLYSPHQDWFLGGQAVSTNYQIIGTSAADAEFLDAIGLTGFDSVAIGATVQFDSRDNQNSPSSGRFFDINNLAYRKSLGGSEDFDAYRLKLQHYLTHGNGHVLASRFSNHWTVDAPKAGYASISLRGYTQGQYLGQNMSAFEIEDRTHFGERWGTTLYTGVACLYGKDLVGDKTQCKSGSSIYTSVAGGLYYVIKPDEKMVVTLEFADGEGQNRGTYLRFGWGGF
jgi:hypothetical protein